MSALPNWKTMDKAARADLLRKYAAEGLSCTQIAKKFKDCTRAAVAGAAKRARRMLQGSPGRQKIAMVDLSRKANGSAGGAVGRVKARVRRKKDDAARDANAEGWAIQINDAAFDPLPGSLPIGFVENTGCKWAVDGRHGPGMLVCGLSKDGHHSYCAAHQRIAYTTPIKRAA